MVFNIYLCFTGLHLRWSREYGYFLFRKLITSLIHRLLYVFSLLISYFICAMRGFTMTCMRYMIAIFFLPVMLGFSGCSLLKLSKDLKQGDNFSLLCGYTLIKSGGQGPVFVVAYEVTDGTPRVAGHVRLSQSGFYELAVPSGRYYIAAFHDQNNNGKLDSFEESGQYGEPDLIDAPNQKAVTFLSLSLSHSKKKVAQHLLAISIPKRDIIRRAIAGDLMDFDDPVFGPKGGERNYWEPISFFKETGANIWFLEPYSPKKIPILFIHGAGGTPRDFKYMAENIDRSVYQPWFFYYPGGLPLDFNAYMMGRKIGEISTIYKFDSLVLAAHSMGGLVTRAFLLGYGEYFPSIKLFISISTPWGGVDTARTGVEQSPVVVPSWKEVAVGSKFMKYLHTHPLPETVRFYLLFSYRGNRNPFKPNNDGTISMASVLDPHIQDEAVGIYGLNEGHASILNSSETLAKFNGIVNSEMLGTPPNEETKKEGSLSVAINLSSEKTREMMTLAFLMLEPVAGESSVENRYLNPLLEKQVVTSIPQGQYLASVIIPSYEVSPIRVPVTFKPGVPLSLNFTAKTQGFLTNTVIPKTGTYELPEIESILLTGQGTKRILRQSGSLDSNEYNAYLFQKDYLHENTFYFFGLKKGVYRITITAKGYKTYTGTYTVTPGQFGNISYIQMEPQSQ